MRQKGTLNGLDILTLRLLLAAGEERNLARVAEQENIAISAVSRRISKFEQRYGCAIFDRHDRGVTPTSDGAAILRRLRAVVEQLQQLANDLIERRDGLAGLVRISADMSAALSGALPRRIAQFVATHPGIEIELDEGISLDIVRAVRVGTCEVGLISGTIDSDGLEIVPWEQDELVALVPQTSTLAHRESLSLVDLIDEPFIGLQRDSALLSLCCTQAQALNGSLNVCIHAMSYESMRAFVGAGLGVAIMPAAAAYPFAEAGGFEVCRLTDSWAHRPRALCFRPNEQLSASARAFLRYMIADRPLAAKSGPLRPRLVEVVAR